MRSAVRGGAAKHEFCRLPGVGQATAEKWYELGLRSVMYRPPCCCCCYCCNSSDGAWNGSMCIAACLSGHAAAGRRCCCPVPAACHLYSGI